MVLLFNLFFFHSFGVFVFIIISWIIFTYLALVVGEGQQKKRQVIIWTGLLQLGGSLLLLIRSFSLIQSLFGFFIVILLVFFTYLRATGLNSIRCLQELVIAPVLVFKSYLKNSLKITDSLLKYNTGTNSRGISYRAGFAILIRSLLFLIPIITILIVLLANADPVFGDYVHKLFNFKFDKHMIDRLIHSVLLLGVFTPFINLTKRKQFRPWLTQLEKTNLVPEMTIVMGGNCFGFDTIFNNSMAVYICKRIGRIQFSSVWHFNLF